MKYIILVFSLGLLISLISTGDPITAFDQIENDKDQEAAARAPQPTDEPISKVKQSSTQTEELKDTTLGDSFLNFVPSELISTDNAVPFPVDI